jgi:hypothetical protein
MKKQRKQAAKAAKKKPGKLKMGIGTIRTTKKRTYLETPIDPAAKEFPVRTVVQPTREEAHAKANGPTLVLLPSGLGLLGQGFTPKPNPGRVIEKTNSEGEVEVYVDAADAIVEDLSSGSAFTQMVARRAVLKSFAKAIEDETASLDSVIEGLVQASGVECLLVGDITLRAYMHKSASLSKERLLAAGVSAQQIAAGTKTSEKFKVRYGEVTEAGQGAVRKMKAGTGRITQIGREEAV